MTRTRPSSRTRNGLPRMASRAAAWGRSTGKPGSFMGLESNTAGGGFGAAGLAEAESWEDAALGFTTATVSSRSTRQRGVYPAADRERVPHVESGGTPWFDSPRRLHVVETFH